VPELPEVETTRRGIAPQLLGRRITGVTVRERRLRWPVPLGIEAWLQGRTVQSLDRRAKYLLFRIGNGTLLVHLGMSGSLRLVAAGEAPRVHDHLDIALDGPRVLRFHDPRRFGCVLWVEGDPGTHPLLRGLGPEPLGPDFDGERLYQRSRGRRSSVKQLIMDARTVVGVGNIYASEALFLAGIDPRRPAGRISRARYAALAAAVRRVLSEAIARGGTTLRDYVSPDGVPGYFSLELRVYGRAGERCRDCSGPIRQQVLAQRSSFFCPHCQR
jgi:formamidopyrimidine-DNA glycosylase